MLFSYLRHFAHGTPVGTTSSMEVAHASAKSTCGFGLLGQVWGLVQPVDNSRRPSAPVHGLGAFGAQLVVSLAFDQSSDRSPSLQRIMQDSGHTFSPGNVFGGFGCCSASVGSLAGRFLDACGVHSKI